MDEKRILVAELREQATVMRETNLGGALARDRCAGELILGYRGGTLEKARALVVAGVLELCEGRVETRPLASTEKSIDPEGEYPMSKVEVTEIRHYRGDHELLGRHETIGTVADVGGAVVGDQLCVMSGKTEVLRLRVEHFKGFNGDERFFVGLAETLREAAEQAEWLVNR